LFLIEVEVGNGPFNYTSYNKNSCAIVHLRISFWIRPKMLV